MTISTRPALALLLLLVTGPLLAQPPAETDTRPAARMAREASPYLQQHADDPVAWFPWGEEAFEKARRENKPIFLSSGYAACHWCHVMQRESFQDAAVAAILNRGFVAIKLDREELPAVDRIYMEAAQRYSRYGAGWPLSAWLLPDRRPFLLGTYFPPTASRTRPAFKDLLLDIEKRWKEQPGDQEALAGRLAKDLDRHQQHRSTVMLPDTRTLGRARFELERSADRRHGGFGKEPKFPRPSAGLMLLRRGAREGDTAVDPLVREMANAIVRGGLHDHLGGGFHRYCVDTAWTIPHFEKMLYDQAQIAWFLLELHAATGQRDDREAVERTLDFCLQQMRAEGGAFIAALDAVAEGDEGGTYLWHPDQIREVLGEDVARVYLERFGLRTMGEDPEGRGVLHQRAALATVAAEVLQPEPIVRETLLRATDRLLAIRANRPQPRRDTKVLTEWNGLLVATLARASRQLDRPEYLVAAREAMTFVLRELQAKDGSFLRSWAGGEARHAGELSDHAAMLRACLALHEATLEASWLDRARTIADLIEQRFRHESGRLVDARGEDLIVSTSWLYDSSQPSGTALALHGLAWLGHLTGDTRRLGIAEDGLRAIGGFLEREPSSASFSLLALDALHGPTVRIEYHGPIDHPTIVKLRKRLASGWFPFCVETHHTLAEGEEPFASVCVGETCLLPATTEAEFLARIATALEM